MLVITTMIINTVCVCVCIVLLSGFSSLCNYFLYCQKLISLIHYNSNFSGIVLRTVIQLSPTCLLPLTCQPIKTMLSISCDSAKVYTARLT